MIIHICIDILLSIQPILAFFRHQYYTNSTCKCSLAGQKTSLLPKMRSPFEFYLVLKYDTNASQPSRLNLNQYPKLLFLPVLFNCDRLFFVRADHSPPSPALMTTTINLFSHSHSHFILFKAEGAIAFW